MGMARSLVTIKAKSADGRIVTTKVFVSDLKTCDQLIKEGCKRLKLEPQPEFHMFELPVENSPEDDPNKIEIWFADEVISFGRHYYFVDKKIDSDNSSVQETPSSSRADSFPATTTSNPQSTPLSQSCSTPKRPLNDLSTTNIESEKLNSLTKPQQIAAYFHLNKDVINAKFQEYKPEKNMLFNSIDLYDFFQERPVLKAAIYVIREKANKDLIEAAKYVTLNALMDIIEKIWPKFDCPRKSREPLILMMNELSNSNLFDYITRPNGKGEIDRRVTLKRSKDPTRESPAAPAPKKFKFETLSEAAEKINDLSLELQNLQTDDKLIHQFFSSSSEKRLAWIKVLLNSPQCERGIATTVLEKFFQIKDDVSLIQYDFQHLMSTRKSPVASLKEKFCDLIPAIFGLAEQKKLFENVSISLENREIHACSLLAKLCKTYSKNSAVNCSKLVLDFTSTPNIYEELERRKKDNVTTPSIIILGTQPLKTFYVAVDDMALIVKGQFSDALQHFMELVFVFNLKYDKETTGICYFFETLIGIETKSNGGRLALKRDLENYKSDA